MRDKKRSYKWIFVGVCSLALLLGSVCFAQKNVTTASDLLKQASILINEKKFDDAADVLTEYLDMVKGSTAEGVIKIAQEKRFRLITMLIRETSEPRLEEAAKQLQDYIDTPIGEHPRLARSLMATCYYQLDEYEKCVATCTMALRYNEDPSSRAGAREWTIDEAERFSKFTAPEFENEYSDEQITSLYMTMAEAYYKAEKWEASIEPYTYVSEHIKDSQVRGYSLMQIINAMVAIPAFDRIAEFIPQLYRTEARFDIRVNLALMDVAAILYGEGQYDEALPLYRMILPREELLAYQRERLREMRIANELPPEEDMKVSEAEKNLFDIEDEPEETDKKSGVPMPSEIAELEKLIKDVEELPPYEIDIKYRMAQIYEAVYRFWEAVKFYDLVYQDNKDSKMGRHSISQIVDLLLERGEVDEAQLHGFKYLKENPHGITPRRVAYLFTRYYHENDDMAGIQALRKYIDAFVRADDDAAVRSEPNLYDNMVKYDAELYFMQAESHLVEFEFPDAEKGFKRVLDDFPGSHQEGNAIYWMGMSMLFQQNFTNAYEMFEEYARRFPEGSRVDEAAYQGGVCLFGIAGEMLDPDYTAASNRFSYVINTYPDKNPNSPKFSTVYPEARNMRGDIYASLGTEDGIAKAEADYRAAIDAATKPSQATYAVFQLATIFKAWEKPDEVIALVEQYLNQWKGQADISKALYWIGTSKLQKASRFKVNEKDRVQMLVDEVVTDYVNAIQEYGADIKQDGVDLMIEELVNLANVWLDFDKQEKLINDLKAAIEATEEPVLRLRLRVVIAMITNTENELGLKLLSELKDFKSVPPPVLATICKVSQETKDYSRAEELVTIFKEQFEDSDLIKGAYKLWATGQYAKEDYDGALKTIDEIQGPYPEDPDMAWAQLMKARVLLMQGELNDAYEANQAVTGVPVWRGEPLAQAIYQLAQVEEQLAHAATGDDRDKHLAYAFNYYQRCYLQFQGYAKGYWAAEGYLASARCLKLLGQEEDCLNTFRAMLLDPFVNSLPQAETAREELGAAKAAEIDALLEAGTITNITIMVENEASETVAPVAEGDE